MTEGNVIGINICKRLNALGMNQRMLAEHVGVTEQSISRYVSGDRIPKATILLKIAKELQTTPSELMGEMLIGDPKVMFSQTKFVIKTFASQWTKAEKAMLMVELLGWAEEDECEKLVKKGDKEVYGF